MGVHELAHVVMMLACGGRVRRLTLRFADLRIDAAGLGYRQELLAALGKYEDLYESVEAELELVRLNLEELSKAGKARSATYTMLTGSRFMLEEMQKRLNEPAEDIAGRLNALKRQLGPEDDGFRDVE